MLLKKYKVLEKRYNKLFDIKQQLQAMFDGAKDAIILIDADGRIIFFNKSAEILFGYKFKDVQNKNMHEILTNNEDNKQIQQGLQSFSRTGCGQIIGKTITAVAYNRERNPIDVEISISNCKIGGKLHAIGIVRDISERKRIESKLHILATTDELSNLLNRRCFCHITDNLLKNNIDQGVALILIDIDNFKQFNDAFGHAFGDEVIRDLSNFLKRKLRGFDIIGRLGGDEFSIFLPNITYAHTESIAERLVNSSKNEITLRFEGNAIHCTISVGAAYVKRNVSFIEIYTLADKALYEAKNKGKCQYFILNY